MANEAVIIELLGNGGDPIRVTVANATGIEKGTLMKISSDPRTATATAASGDKFIGIAAAEKVANDGATEIAVYTKGIFDLKSDNTGSALGVIVAVGGANLTETAVEADYPLGNCIGKNLETVSANEVGAVFVYPI